MYDLYKLTMKKTNITNYKSNFILNECTGALHCVLKKCSIL